MYIQLRTMNGNLTTVDLRQVEQVGDGISPDSICFRNGRTLYLKNGSAKYVLAALQSREFNATFVEIGEPKYHEPTPARSHIGMGVEPAWIDTVSDRRITNELKPPEVALMNPIEE